jgi:hypothetical protein
VRGPGGAAQVHCGPRARRLLAGARMLGLAGAHRRRWMRWCSPKQQRRLELVARAKEGTKEIGREGKRGGEGRGDNSGINGFNAIEDRARLRGVLRRGLDGGAS